MSESGRCNDLVDEGVAKIAAEYVPGTHHALAGNTGLLGVIQRAEEAVNVAALAGDRDGTRAAVEKWIAAWMRACTWKRSVG